MIFKEIEEGLAYLKREIVETNSDDKETLLDLKRRLKILLEVAEYVDSCEWLTKQDAKEKITKIRASKYNYKLIREELNLTEDAIKSFMKYCIRKVKDKVGDNTVELILEGDLRVAAVQFYTLSGRYKLQDLIMLEVYKELPESRFNPDTLLNCRKEIEFLLDYSNAEFKRRYEELDKDKLEFVRYIIEKNTPKYSEEKYKLVGLLLGQTDRDVYFEELEYDTNFRP